MLCGCGNTRRGIRLASLLQCHEDCLCQFPTINLGNISKANDNSFVKLREVSTDHLDELTGYDMVFVNGMGLRIVEEQRQQIQRAADKGIPVYTSMATNPANNICNLDSVQMSQIRQYLTNAGKVNYRNLLSYVRKEIDGKLISAPVPEAPVEKPTDILYHAGVKRTRMMKWNFST